MKAIEIINWFNFAPGSQLMNDTYSELIFGKKVELKLTNIKEKYETQLSLFNLAISDGFADKKIYAYYIYALIITNQNLLIQLLKEIDTDYNIEYYKNTFVEWQALIDEIKLDAEKTLNRFLCYETFFKQLFDIKYDERNFDVIREKIVVFNKLSNEQKENFTKFIFRPLFDGFFDFNASNISVIKCIENNCETFIIKDFPYPVFDLSPDRKFPEHNVSVYDCIRPWIIYDSVTLKKVLGQDYLDSWAGTIDLVIKQFTGLNKGYTIKAGKKVEEITNTAGDWYDKMKKEFRDLKNSLSNAYQNTTSGFDSFITAITYGGIALGGYFVYDLLTSESKK